MGRQPGWLALATSKDYPELPAEERPLIEALHAAGYDAQPVVWDDPAVRWETAGAVLIRACWDYHLSPQRFLDWLATLERHGVTVLNPPGVIRHNLHKGYLLDLASRGVPIVPTVVALPDSGTDLGEVLWQQDWDEAVIKPLVSGGAHRTWRLKRSEAPAYADRFATARQETGVLIQAFMPEIVTDGEWSLVYIDRQLSHVVCKRPKAGDFRVQDIHGGTLEVYPSADVDPAWRSRGEHVLRLIPGDLTYARLDGILRQGQLIIMEVELIEPNLFLAAEPKAIGRLVAALRSRLPTT